MVKRIKKRIPKAEEPAEIEFDLETEAEAEEGAADEPVSLAEQLTAMAEDDFTQKTAGLFRWIIDNGKVLATVGGLAAVGVIGYTLMQRNSHAADAEASAAFFGAAEAAEKARPLGAAKPGEAVDAEARKAQLEKARQLFQAAKKSYSDRTVARLSGLGEALTQATLGEHDAALTAYDAYLGAGDVDAFARVVAMQGKATVQENKGDFAGAAATWTAIRDADKAFGLLASMNIGRLQEAEGKAAEARATYEKVQKDFAEALGELPNRPFKAELDKRLARLGKS